MLWRLGCPFGTSRRGISSRGVAEGTLRVDGFTGCEGLHYRGDETHEHAHGGIRTL